MLVTGPNAIITVAVSSSLAAAIDIGDGGLVAIQMPSAWTAASVTFQASAHLNGTYNDVYDITGTELSITGAAASRYIPLNASTFGGMRYIKIRSGTTGTPVVQTANRTIRTLVRRLS